MHARVLAGARLAAGEGGFIRHKAQVELARRALELQAVALAVQRQGGRDAVTLHNGVVVPVCVGGQGVGCVRWWWGGMWVRTRLGLN